MQTARNAHPASQDRRWRSCLIWLAAACFGLMAMMPSAGAMPRAADRSAPAAAQTVPAKAKVAAANGCVISPDLVNSCGPWQGAAVSMTPGVAPDPVSQFTNFEQTVGVKLGMPHTYLPSNQIKLRPSDEALLKTHQVMYITWASPLPWGQMNAGNPVAMAKVQSMITSIGSVDHAGLLFGFSHEPENKTTPGPGTCDAGSLAHLGTPAEYVAAYRFVHAQFEAAGVHVTWVWNPMGSLNHWCMMDALDPGVEDWIGLDVYPRSGDFVGRVQETYDWFMTHDTPGHCYTCKHWMLAETNYLGGDEQAAYDMYDNNKWALDTDRFPKLQAYIYFAARHHSVDRWLMSDTPDPVRLAHFQALIQDPHFAPTAGGTPLPPSPAPTPVPTIPPTASPLPTLPQPVPTITAVPVPTARFNLARCWMHAAQHCAAA